MRARTVLVASLFLLTPLFVVHAAEPAAPESQEPQAVSSCSKDQCQDEEVVVSPSAKPPVSCKPGKIIPKEQCKCQVSNGKYSGAGIVTWKDVTGKTTKTISKCEPNYAKRMDRVSDALQSDDPAEALKIEEARNLLETSIRAGELPKEISDAFSPAQLNTFKQELQADPRSAAEKIGALMYGDTAEKQAAAQSLGVTSDQLDRLGKLAVRLTPPKDTYESTVSTFKNNLSGYQPPVAQVTGFGATDGRTTAPQNLVLNPTGSPSAPTRKSMVNGRLQEITDPKFLGNSINKTSEVFCSKVAGPCHATPDAIVSTMMNETNGNVRALGDGGHSASLAQVYAAQSGMAQFESQYKAAWGEDYVLHKIDITDPKYNPEWIATQSIRMQAVVLQNKGGNVGGNYARLLAAYNGSGPAAAAYGSRALQNTRLLQTGNAASYWQTVYDTAKAGGGPSISTVPPTGIPTSPFANVSMFNSAPVGSSGPTGSPLGSIFQSGGSSPRPSVPSGGAPSTPTQPIQQPAQGGTPTTPGQGGTGGAGGAGGAAPTSPAQQLEDALKPTSQTPQTLQPVEAVATIIAQPSEITKGKSIIVSWSTVGMSTNVPCTVMLSTGTSTSVVGQGNEGTRSIETSTTSASGAWDFVLKCTAANGGVVERSTSVPVQ